MRSPGAEAATKGPLWRLWERGGRHLGASSWGKGSRGWAPGPRAEAGQVSGGKVTAGRGAAAGRACCQPRAGAGAGTGRGAPPRGCVCLRPIAGAEARRKVGLQTAICFLSPTCLGSDRRGTGCHVRGELIFSEAGLPARYANKHLAKPLGKQ